MGSGWSAITILCGVIAVDFGLCGPKPSVLYLPTSVHGLAAPLYLLTTYRSADGGAGPTGSKGTVHCLY